MMPTKQTTKHVEWYHGDFSDPEAVSGSSTKFESQRPLGSFFCCSTGNILPVENSVKIYKKIIQKCIDLSISRLYNRGSS